VKAKVRRQTHFDDKSHECLESGLHMIVLRKINNAPIAVNSDLIQYIEETPDTVITMTNNDKVVVQEGMNEIIQKVVQFRRHINRLIDLEYERQGGNI
jgi:flagellar protein FlbD